ncbi:hypothetical protein OG883_42835 [Streptomyces sp. NBC_01142]|uniref:hypothetical protein n=1 Tax=Streptomyces sp. NBC_01142 TaxID=2975865 RepID=UPI002250D6EF|nr:hypothetical protein [Streptomyces sp. NBC_01142]MCX4826381.1 hypothetical protein [Streptomyces sp. NBC_01142]
MRSDTDTRGAWVVLGGIHLLNGISPRRADEPILLVQVAPQEVCLPSTTVVIKWDTLGACQVSALTADASPLRTNRIEGGSLFPDAIAGHALRELAGDDAPAGLVPLCYLSEHPGGGYHVYAQIHFYAEDACFVRTTHTPVGEGPVEALRWLNPALDAHAESALRLNNHLRYFRTHFAGTELEYKYNLEAADIWEASLELLKALRRGELVDCRPEYRNELQTYYTENHLYDVTGPPADLGYASFIPTVDGGHVLKRKWFAEDSFARREQLYTDLKVSPDGFEDYLCSQLGLEVRAMPPFRRVRYDVQCESMRTGHVYGIFFDHCSLLAAPEVVLSQCEMEYRRSRSLLDHRQSEVLREMERIDRWLLGYLAERGWAKSRTFYSKRSFLRDAIAARPELIPNH